MSSASVLQQSFARASDRASTRSALAEQFSPEDMIEFGEFRIDIRNRTVALCGQNLELTSEEFDVLVFLIGHPQRLITPHTLLTTSWTTNQQRQTEFLPALLSLRKKLDAASPGKRYLRTEPWVVYRFDQNPSSKL
jgi:two-component system phosphate regulon response regulator OmpR